MSAYVTLAQIQGEIQPDDLIALTDDANTGSLNMTVLNQAIANGSGIVDMYCANIYGSQLPFNPVPLAVQGLALAITVYLLFERRQNPSERNTFGDRYKAAIKFLEKVNDGKMRFDDTSPRDFSQVAASYRATPWGAGNYPASSM